MGKSIENRAFISVSEELKIRAGAASGDPVMSHFFRALEKRVYGRLGRNLDHLGETTEWCYPAAEYLSDAAMLYLLQPEERLRSWLHDITLELIRKPAYDCTPGYPAYGYMHDAYHSKAGTGRRRQTG